MRLGCSLELDVLESDVEFAKKLQFEDTREIVLLAIRRNWQAEKFLR